MKYAVMLALVDTDPINFECTGYAVGDSMIEFALGGGTHKWFPTANLLELTVSQKSDTTLDEASDGQI